MKLCKKLLSVMLAAVIILLLTACGENNDAYIYFAVDEQPYSLDPQTASMDIELMIIRNIFEGLMRKDQNGKIVCAAAESYKKQGLTYTFYLKDGLMWSNEKPLTAADFVFAFKRAVLPKTKAPFVERLFCIKNAKSIYKGECDVSKLGVKANSDKELAITLQKDDKNFLENLSTAIAMPCNKEFFNSAAGKYGLNGEAIISNGSYRLTKWNKEIFGIRIYRNKYYKGNFTAKNYAVFFSADKERDSFKLLTDNDADVAFIKPEQSKSALQSGFQTKSYNNITWFLTVSDGFSKSVRKSLISLAKTQIKSNSFASGYYPAKSIFPDIITTKKITAGQYSYKLSEAKKMFIDAVNNSKDGKFPSNVILYYYDSGTSKDIVTSVVGHWQKQLSAFVNIESVSSPDVLLSQLKDQTYALAVFPVTADSNNPDEYLKNFGITHNGESLTHIQKELLKPANLTPLFTQDTVLAYSKLLTNLNLDTENGYIDFSYILKDE